MRLRYGHQARTILENHYNWCKQNGRDTKWYKKYKEVDEKKLPDEILVKTWEID